MKRRTLIIVGTLLVAVLLVLGACAPTPAPEETPAPTPAKFKVISLDVKSTEVTAGETVSITADVKNIGGSEGTYPATLTVDGVTVESKEVAILPDSSEMVTFSLIEDTPGTYEIGIGELSSTLIVKETAKFEVISLDVTPPEVTAGETVSITAVVKNIGGSEGTYAAILTVDGATVETKEVAVAPGSSEVVTFSLVKEAPGTYEIGVGELSSTLTVKETAIEITFNPNPVPCEDGHWYWRVILTEVNGVGVKLNNLTMYIYRNDHLLDTWTYDSSSMAEWFGSAYLPASSSVNFGAGFPCQAITHEIVTITGIDDNGNEITATGRVDFLQPD